jgi:hypothetical protein
LGIVICPEASKPKITWRPILQTAVRDLRDWRKLKKNPELGAKESNHGLIRRIFEGATSFPDTPLVAAPKAPAARPPEKSQRSQTVATLPRDF